MNARLDVLFMRRSSWQVMEFHDATYTADLKLHVWWFLPNPLILEKHP